MNWQIFSQKKGSAGFISDYIWGLGNSEDKDDVLAVGCGNLPSWAGGVPKVFWCGSDRLERKGGSAARHLILSLPRELSLGDQITLVEKLIELDLGAKPYQYAIHDPHRGDPENSHPHVHILYCDRVPDGIEREAEMFFRRPNVASPEQGGCKKDSGGKSKQEMGALLLQRKGVWGGLQNEALFAAGHSARVDLSHTSLRANK